MSLDDLNKEIHDLEPSALIELFELDLSPIGPSQVYYFHAGTNNIGGDIIWGPLDLTYTSMPISINGFQLDGSGGLPRPKMLVSNIGGVFSALVNDNDDLIGAQVTRRRTFAKFLNAANFPEGVNPTEDKYQEFPTDVYVIEQKKAENPHMLEFELASILDTENIRLPKRKVHASFCDIQYRSLDCGYAGPPATNATGKQFFPEPNTDDGVDNDDGDYDNTYEYSKWDKTKYNGQQWVALQTTIGNAPVEGVNWTDILNYSKGTWASGTTYNENEYVVKKRDGVVFVFVSKVDNNQGNAPPDSVWWDVDVCNKKIEGGCGLRFGRKGPYPAALFPGTAQYY